MFRGKRRGLPLITNESEWFNKRNVALIPRNHHHDLVCRGTLGKNRDTWLLNVVSPREEAGKNNNNDDDKRKKKGDSSIGKKSYFRGGGGDVAAKY